MLYFLIYSLMEKKLLTELELPKVVPMKSPMGRIHLSRAQIFRLLKEEDLNELERGQAPIYTQFINPNLP